MALRSIHSIAGSYLSCLKGIFAFFRRRSRISLCCMFMLILGTVSLSIFSQKVLAGVTIGADSKIPSDPRQKYATYVRFRPADGQVVKVNPPRFSWPYLPEIAFTKYFKKADQRFTLQISKTQHFSSPEVQVKNISINFYNFLPELKGSRVWYWRVGYNIGTKKKRWSNIRSFRLASNAVVWDRSHFKQLLDSLKGHPRILFNKTNRNAVLKRCKQNSKSVADYIVKSANKTIKSDWYNTFPKSDKKINGYAYIRIGSGLTCVAFAYLLTGDDKYLSCKERFLRIASWPFGGPSSPEGASEKGAKWPSHLTEYLGLFYDWFYDKLSPSERATVRQSLEWRIKWTLNNFAWLSMNGTKINYKSIGVKCSSHAYENLMVTIPGALAICDESEIARKALEVGLNYLVGITNGMGEDEAWSQGPGYGNGKMKWLMDATWYLETAIPELNLSKNHVYDAYIDFFARITPIGAEHSSFGNRGYNERDWLSARIINAYRVAMLTKNSVAMQNWLDSKRRLADLGRSQIFSHSPWIDFVLSYYGNKPSPEPESTPYKLFPLEGWVTVSSAPPSDYNAQKKAVSMTFACRPRGAESHAFPSANSFDIYAFGQTVTVGGGTTTNKCLFADDTMSHNTILIDGQGQMTTNSDSIPLAGRIIAFRKGADFIYWCGDATDAYGVQSGLLQFQRHVVFVDNAYFVIFDDLLAKRPATFQWLYHITPAVPIIFDSTKFAFRYTIGKVNVIVQDCANVDDLTYHKYRGAKGLINPITGENLKSNADTPLDAYHIWISNKTPRKKMQFLTVIVPFLKGTSPPIITPIDDVSVKVKFQGKQKLISFVKNSQADISVDLGVSKDTNSSISEPKNIRIIK